MKPKTKCRICNTRTASPDGLCCDHRNLIPRACEGCRQVKRIKAKGLCGACYDRLTPCVRCGIARKIQRGGVCGACIKRGESASRIEDVEPTEEELERTIAEQSQHLPPWWNNAKKLAKRESDSRAGIRVLRVRVVDGRIATVKHPFLW